MGREKEIVPGAIFAPYETHLLVYNCISILVDLTPRAFTWGTLKQQQGKCIPRISRPLFHQQNSVSNGGKGGGGVPWRVSVCVSLWVETAVVVCMRLCCGFVTVL